MKKAEATGKTPAHSSVDLTPEQLMDRLRRERDEAVELQAASAEVLEILGSSPGDMKPVFEAMLGKALRICDAKFGHILLYDGECFHAVHLHDVPPSYRAFWDQHGPIRPDPRTALGQLAGAKQVVHIPDLKADRAYAERQPLRVVTVDEAGARSFLGVPMLKEDKLAGAIVIYRQEVRPFASKQIELVKTFATQAVIAIENTRLFNEVKQRTNDLAEALTYQTGSGNILRVIASSPTDVGPVLNAIVESASELCEADDAIVFLEDGRELRSAAHSGPIAEGPNRVPIARTWMTGRSFLDGKPIHVRDVLSAEGAEFPNAQEIARSVGHRTMLTVPLLREGESIGVIMLRRKEVNPFVDKQIALLQTFADQAVIAIENTRLFNETKEALERQTATADILKVIASSPSDVQPVFEAIAEQSKRLVDALSTTVFRLEDGVMHLAAFSRTNPEVDAALQAMFPAPLTSFSWGESIRRGEIYRVTDTENEPEGLRDLARKRGWRSCLCIPLLRDGKPIGMIGPTRAEPGPFADHDVQLLQTFADQAVIAIENARLFNETQEALDRQTATSEILQAISSSLTDITAVFETILDNCVNLGRGDRAVIWQFDGQALRLVAGKNTTPEAMAYLRQQPLEIGRHNPTSLAALERRIVHELDAFANPTYRPLLPIRTSAPRAPTVLAVPLVRDDKLLGVITIWRHEKIPFTDKQIQLVETFASQAVIAIQNTRLFNETKEALARQTATSDVLKVIASSPSNLQPVFDAIAERSKALIGAHSTVVVRHVDGLIELAAFTPVNPEADAALQALFPRPPNTGDPQTLQVLRGEIARMSDAEAELQGNVLLEAARARGWRSRLLVPLKDETGVTGWISVTRKETGGFAEKDVELLQTFADQAVIAIKNVELFEEVQARTRALQESLQQQTATSEVLQIISASPGDLAPVFDKMLENATRVCGAEFGSMVLVEGGAFRRAALYNAPPAFVAAQTDAVFQIHPQSTIATAIRNRQVVQIDDVRASPAYLERAPHTVELVELGGARTIVVVPMLREDDVIGLITVYRKEVRTFGDKQIDLLTNFARQAVIAIENARLLRELRQRTDDLSEALVYQTGSSNILKVIASSPTDVEPALKAIVDSASEICDAYDVAVLLKEGEELRFSAHHGTIPMEREKWPINRRWFSGRAVTDKLTQHVHDVFGPEGDDFPEGRELARQDGHRTVLSVPLLQEGEAIGAITLRRKELYPFNNKQIELLKSFADQAVIAISNVRLFEQVQQRTSELSKSLDDLRAAQDRLVQTEKLASLGQLTAGIAHEIKNPLNFVNNFSALSAELTGELNDLLKDAALTDKMRTEVEELTRLLHDNLEKVVQHGKRADSIVKNMLLHSREGSGERRSADVNALVDESLNLAYHGARAEKSGFNITLQRRFDAGAGAAELFPQEITRALLNLISNGFYAATRRKTENGEAGFEPTLLARTRDLGGSVEIRIRDNGTGIPPEVKEKMFNPFFTTKPAGEGTGLGLSMTHDIIVKQHGGQIEVHTEPGSFTEFTIILPRTGPK